MKIADYMSLDGIGLAALVRKGEVAPVEALEAALARADAVNPKLNALVLPQIDYARSLIASGSGQRAFQAVPFLLKDMTVDIEGWPMTNGCRIFADHVATCTVELGKRYLDAGLVPFGRTTAPELGFSTDTFSSLYGETCNPWDSGLSAGGSSGGSAALVAAGVVPVAHAGDGGGSIRIPSAFCGVFGLKPSRGRNPTGPLHPEGLFGMVSNHAISRTVRDSAALLDITCGPDIGAPYIAPIGPRSYADEAQADPPRPLRIGLQIRGFTGVDADPACVAAAQDVAWLCEDLGHEVEVAELHIDAQHMHEIYDIFFCTLADVVVGGRARSLGREPREGDAEPVTMEMLRRARSLSASDYMTTLYAAHAMARDFSRAFQPYDLVLSPTTIQARKPRGRPSLIDGNIECYYADIFADVSFTAIFNITGLPAMSVPVYWSADGMPIGVQFGAQYGREDILFQLAGQLERARSWQHRYACCPAGG